MDDPRAWQVRADHPIKAVQSHAAALTASIEPFKQKTPRLMRILAETATVATHSVILEYVALEMSTDVLQHGFTSAGPHCRQTHAEGLDFLPDAFALSLAANNETSAAGAPDKVREAQEVKGLRPT